MVEVNDTLATQAILATMERRIAQLEYLVSIMAGSGGGEGGFFGFGLSSKPNAWPTQESGYDPVGDRLYGSGQLFIQTQDDAPTMYCARRENGGSITGWPDNNNVFRIDAVPVDKNGDVLYPNGADNAAAAIGMNLHFPDAGISKADAYSTIRFQVIRGNHSSTSKPPLTVLEVSGKNGGEVWGYWYEAGGTQHPVQLVP